MTTRPPAGVQTFPESSMEKIAYASVETVPVREPNDRTRLGYHVWQYLCGRVPALEEAMHSARSRLLVTEEEAAAIVRKNLSGSDARIAGVTDRAHCDERPRND